MKAKRFSYYFCSIKRFYLKALFALIFVLLTTFCLISISFSQEYIPGEVCYGNKKYIEYHLCNLPVILTAPHGGRLMPQEIPNRKYGFFYHDEFTKELILDIKNEYYKYSGKYPHVIICNLHRKKLDANRNIEEAAQGNIHAIKAWDEYQKYINLAKKTVTDQYKAGLLLDIHGYGREGEIIILGYSISGNVFNTLSDEEINKLMIRKRSSISSLAGSTKMSYSALLHGSSSLGTLFEEYLYPAVPSLKNPKPGSSEYFGGGFTVYSHGSFNGGKIDAILIETPWIGVRESDKNRKRFSKIFVRVVDKFAKIHYGNNFFKKND
jgi:hypothetical protein